MTHTKNNRWFIFYQDQLLLEKKNNEGVSKLTTEDTE